MGKFKFGENYAAIVGNVRVSEATHHKLKSIAQQKGVSMQEVVRVFIDFALEEFEKEYAEHYFPPTQSDKQDGMEVEGNNGVS